MANYNLGSVQGEIRITYNGRGTGEARRDVEAYIGDLERLLAELRRASEEEDRSSSSREKSAKKAKEVGDSLEKVGNIMQNVAKIPFLVGAAQNIAGVAAGLAPMVGLLAALPAVGGAAAIMFGTVKIATMGMGDAFKAVAEGDAKALDEAMKKLPPSAQQVVKSYAAMKPLLDGLKMNVQGAFFKDLAPVVDSLGKAYIPVLNRGLTDVAGGWNFVAKESAKSLALPSTVSSLNTLLGNTADTTTNFGSALGDVLAGVINIAGVGSNWLTIWTSGTSDLTSRFREWTASAAGQAQINTWIQQGANALGELVKLLTNLGSIASGVWSAMQVGGGGALQTLIDLTSQMAQWVNSAEGQQTLIALFQLTHDVFEKVLAILTPILEFVGNLVTAYGSLSGPMQDVVSSAIAWAGVLGTLIGYAAPVISFMIAHWSQIVAIAIATWNVIAATSVWIASVVRMAAVLAANAIRMAASWLIAMGPIGWIIAAVIALVALIVLNWDWVKAKTIEIWTAVVTFLTGLWDSIVAQATSVWTAVTTWLAGVWQTVVDMWTTAWNAVVAFFQPIWDTIVSIITVAWEVIKNIFIFWAAILLAIFFSIFNPIAAAAVAIWTAISEFFTMIWTSISTAATTLWNMIVQAVTLANQAILDFITPIWNAIVAFVTGIWNGIVSTATSIWNTLMTAVNQANQAISNFVTPIWNTISGFLTGIWNTVSGVARSVWNAISQAVTQANQAISNFIMPIWNSISSFLSNVWNTITGAVRSGATNVLNAITSIWNGIVNQASNAINLLVSAGRNIVIGLWNGIAAMGSWLYGQIMGWIRSVVPGPVLQFLGIASPSKWARDVVGKQIPAGLAEGVEANTRIAEAAALTMAKKVADAAHTQADASMQEVKVKLGSVSEDVWQKLLAAGFKGKAGDGEEALYGPKSVLASTMNPGLASSVSAGTGASSISTTTATNNAVNSTNNARTIQIGSLTIPVTGNLDPTNPVQWREAIEQLREAITNVEASYR